VKNNTDVEATAMLDAIAGLHTALSGLNDGVRTLNAVQQLGATPRPIRANQSGPLSTSAGRLAGYSVRETSGTAAAVLRLRDGEDVSDPGNILITISLSAGESTRDWYLPLGVSFTAGLYVEIVSGAIEGAAFILGQQR
jgi:hypothetical protein